MSSSTADIERQRFATELAATAGAELDAIAPGARADFARSLRALAAEPGRSPRSRAVARTLRLVAAELDAAAN